MQLILKSDVYWMSQVLLDIKRWDIRFNLLFYYLVVAFLHIFSNGYMAFSLLDLMTDVMANCVEFLDITDLAYSWGR